MNKVIKDNESIIVVYKITNIKRFKESYTNTRLKI